MKRTPEVECRHAINLHDCRTEVAETLAELAGKLNEEGKKFFCCENNNKLLCRTRTKDIDIDSFARDV